MVRPSTGMFIVFNSGAAINMKTDFEANEIWEYTNGVATSITVPAKDGTLIVAKRYTASCGTGFIDIEKIGNQGAVTQLNCLAEYLQADRGFNFRKINYLQNSPEFLMVGSFYDVDSLGDPLPFKQNAMIAKLDSNFNILWMDSIGGSEIDIFFNSIQVPTGDLVVYGSTRSYDGDLQIIRAGAPQHLSASKLWLVKYSSLLNTKDLTNAAKTWRITPTQPNTYTVQFTGDATKFPIEITLTDALGKNIANYTATSTELNIDLTKYQQGIYFLSAKGYKTQKLGR
jgi:hypothetical protein